MSDNKKDGSTEDFNRVRCCTCGILFGFSKEIEELWRDSHQNFHCPNGHSLHWDGPTSQDKDLKELRKKVEELKKKVESLSAELANEKKASEALRTELEIWKPTESPT